MAIYDYRIAAGTDVALVSLTNVEDLLTFAPRSQPVDIYPVRRTVLSGAVVGNGTVNHVWTWAVLPIADVKLLEDTFFTSGTVVSANVTIYTRRHDRAAYTRYNAIAVLPQPGQDFEYDRKYARNVRLTFRNLTAAT
jgi:hypothetical protein